MSATFADFYQRAYIRQTGNGLTPDSGLPQLSVCEHPAINENTKNRYTTSRPLKMKCRNFKMVGWFTDGKKLQYYIQIEHIKVKIEVNKENHIKNYPAFS